MRFLLLLCICFLYAQCSALAQHRHAPHRTASQRTSVRRTAVQQAIPQPTAPQRTAPPADPFIDDPQPSDLDDPQPSELADPITDPEPFELDDPDPSEFDDLDLDSSQSFDFDDSADFQDTGSSDFESSIASNSNFRGASPQMIGDFGGGSTILSIGDPPNAPLPCELTVPIPIGGGSRRIKFAENNQVQPSNRIGGTFNHFHNAIVAGGMGAMEQSEDLNQGAFGIEKAFFDDLISLDVRMSFTGGLRQSVGSIDALGPTEIDLRTGGVGNLGTAIKALLLQRGQTSVSGGLGVSLPTGSDVFVEVRQDFGFFIAEDSIRIENDAVHLMPFLGVYRPIGCSWWLQAFTQVDVPTRGNDVRTNGEFMGRLTAQTLLYSDVSLGKWLYRNRNNRRRHCGQWGGLTGIAALLELHYTGTLNDADDLQLTRQTVSRSEPAENRYDALNLTYGLIFEFGEVWRINVAGVAPLRDREFLPTGERREDRFFDSEFALQINRFF